MIQVLTSMPESRSYLIVSPERSEAIERAAGNLQNVRTIRAGYVNDRDLLKYDRLLLTRDSIDVIEGILALPEEKRTPSSWKQARLAAAEEAAANG